MAINTFAPQKSQIIAHTLHLYNLGNYEGALQGLRLLNPNIDITTESLFRRAMENLQSNYGSQQEVAQFLNNYTHQDAPRTQTPLQRMIQSGDNFQNFEPYYPEINRSQLVLQAAEKRDRFRHNIMKGKFAVSTFEGRNKGDINHFALSDGKLISADAFTIKVWDLKTEKCMSFFDTNRKTKGSHSNDISFIKKIGNKVYEGTILGEIHIWDLEAQQPSGLLGKHKLAEEGQIAYLSDFNGHLLSVASDSVGYSGCSEAKIWDLNSGTCLHTFKISREEFTSSSYTLFNGKLFVGNEGGCIQIYDLGTNQHVGSLEGHDSYSSALLGWDKMLFAGYEDGTIKIYDEQTSKAHLLKGHKLEIQSFKVFNGLLFSSSYDGTIKVWNFDTGECLNTFKVAKEHDEFSFEIDKGKMYVSNKNEITVFDFTVVTPNL